MSETAKLHVCCPADRDRPKLMRHAVDSFLQVFKIDRDTRNDILTAVGEALSNAVEHAYRDQPTGNIELRADLKGSILEVEVKDDGRFIHQEPREGRGFGLRIIEALTLRVSIDHSEGTSVRMCFTTRRDDFPQRFS